MWILILSSILTVCHGKEVIDLNKPENDRYIQKYENSEINYTSCQRMQFYDDPDIEPEEECHISMLNKTDSVQEEYGVHVRPCCPFHGFIEPGQCDGKNKDGQEARFIGVDVCLRPDGSKIGANKIDMDCPLDCELIIKPLGKGSVTSSGVLQVEGDEFQNFCLAHRCDSNGDKWEHQYEACGNCKAAEEANTQLRSAYPNKDLCCGPKGELNTKTQTCEAGVMSPALEAQLDVCNYKNKTSVEMVKVDIGKTDVSNFSCLGWTSDNYNDNYKGGALCKDDCDGNPYCFQSCYREGVALTLTNFKQNLSSDFNLTEVLGLDTSSKIVYGRKFGPVGDSSQCKFTSKTLELFPEETCEERVDFMKDGSILIVESGVKINYGNFCISPLAGDLTRGRYKISTCHPKEEKEAPDSKYEFYYIILSISIVCLSATLLIYAIFKDALLRSEYNKIMMNFASSLLLAFLTLVVMNTLDGSKMTPALCTGFTITNQFSLLSAFTLMTFMSYDIFKQIHGMTVMSSKKRDAWKHILIAYSISGSISLLTLIVELAAPKCSNIRPKFGMRSCHFYGKLDKFIWLYLPILILLLINSFMFVYILRNIIQNSKSETSGKDGRKESADKMCLYLRLFLGMGIIWFFEILAFSLSSFDIGAEWFYFTDCINMLQGVWVFIIFVCKRNVMKVVMRKKERLYSIFAKTMSKQRQETKENRGRTEGSAASRTENTSLSLGSSIQGQTPL